MANQKSGKNNAAQTNGSQRPQRAQIFVLKTDKRVFEALDGLDTNPKFNKVQLNLVDHEKDPSIFVSHSINPDALKVVALEILGGTFSGYTEYKGSANSKRDDGKPEARVLKITKNDPTKMRIPYSITIETGEGEVIGQGAVKMVKKEQSVSLAISEFDLKRFAVSVLDYIRAWEVAQATAKVNATPASAAKGA